MTTRPEAAAAPDADGTYVTVRAFDRDGRLIGSCRERGRPALLALHLPAETVYAAHRVVASDGRVLKDRHGPDDPT